MLHICCIYVACVLRISDGCCANSGCLLHGCCMLAVACLLHVCCIFFVAWMLHTACLLHICCMSVACTVHGCIFHATYRACLHVSPLSAGREIRFCVRWELVLPLVGIVAQQSIDNSPTIEVFFGNGVIFRKKCWFYHSGSGQPQPAKCLA